MAEAEIRSLAARKMQLAVRLAHVERERDKALQVGQYFILLDPQRSCTADYLQVSASLPLRYTKNISRCACTLLTNHLGIVPHVVGIETAHFTVPRQCCNLVNVVEKHLHTQSLEKPLSLSLSLCDHRQNAPRNCLTGAGNRRGSLAQNTRLCDCHHSGEQRPAILTSANLASGPPPASSVQPGRQRSPQNQATISW